MDCINHTSRDNGNGYGFTMLSGKRVLCHRVAFALGHGVDPAGFVVRHTCDNRACVNPEHLVLGTPADNCRDMVIRGRSLRGESSPHMKLTDAHVAAMRAMLASGSTVRATMAAFGASKTHVYGVKNGTRR